MPVHVALHSGPVEKAPKDAVVFPAANAGAGAVKEPAVMGPIGTATVTKMSRAELEAFVSLALAEKEARRVAKTKAQAKWRGKSKKETGP